MRKLGLVGLLLCGALGCGGDGDGGGAGGSSGGGGTGGGVFVPPSTHLLDAAGAVRDVPAGSLQEVGPFTVPTGATVTFTLADMPVGFGSDSMNAGIATDATAAAADPVVFGLVTGVSSTQGTTPALSAGSYDLLVKCANLLDDCFFTDEITAFY